MLYTQQFWVQNRSDPSLFVECKGDSLPGLWNLERRIDRSVSFALIMLLLNAQTTALGFTFTVLFVLVFLAVLVRVGLVAAAAFFFILLTLSTSPPLILDQWYAGRAMIALLLPLTLLFWGFYVSLGSQPVFGSALKDE
jgi:hypothetical protein